MYADPYHFGPPDPVPFKDEDLDPDSKESVKIMGNFHENRPKSSYHIFFIVVITHINNNDFFNWVIFPFV